MRHSPPLVVVVVLAAALLQACEPVAPPLPDRAVALMPPPVYATWWRMVESCSGRTRSMHSLRWYEVPGASEVPVNGRDAAGYWSRAGNHIVLAGEHVRNGELVRHEMLHAVLDGGGHPREQFLGACAAVVSCSRECVEGSFQPPSPAVAVTSGALRVAVEVTPREPTPAVDGGFFTLTVSVHNPSAEAVKVVAGVNQADVRAFGYELQSRTWGFRSERRAVNDASTLWFAPLETKRYVFDFHLRAGADPTGLAAGDYVAVGVFDVARSPSIQFSIPQ